MAYYDVALLRQDAQFRQRVSACYATERPDSEYPDSWAASHAWDMAAQPGFGDAYASALAAEVPNPGADPSVISDAQILSAVQPMLGATP